MKYDLVFVIGLVFSMVSLTQAATLHWTGGATSNDWKTADAVELPNPGTLDADFEAVTNRVNTAGKSNEFFRIKVDH